MKFSETLIDPLLTNSANYFYKYTENIKIKKYDDDCYIPPTLSSNIIDIYIYFFYFCLQ